MSVESRTTYLGFIKGRRRNLPPGEEIVLELDIKTASDKHWFSVKRRELHVRNPNLVVVNNMTALDSPPKIKQEPLTGDQINDAEISVVTKFMGIKLRRTEYGWKPDGYSDPELFLAA